MSLRAIGFKRLSSAALEVPGYGESFDLPLGNKQFELKPANDVRFFSASGETFAKTFVANVTLIRQLLFLVCNRRSILRQLSVSKLLKWRLKSTPVAVETCRLQYQGECHVLWGRHDRTFIT